MTEIKTPYSYNSLEQVSNHLTRHNLRVPGVPKLFDAHLKTCGMLISGGAVVPRLLSPRSSSGLSSNPSSLSDGTLSTSKFPIQTSSGTNPGLSDDRSIETRFQAAALSAKLSPETEQVFHRLKQSLSATDFPTSGKPSHKPKRSRSLSDIASTSAVPSWFRQSGIRPFLLKGGVTASSSVSNNEQASPKHAHSDDIDRIAVLNSLQERPVDKDQTLITIHRNSLSFYDAVIEGREVCVRSVTPKLRPDANDETLKRKGAMRIRLQKHAMQLSQVGLNGLAIFSTWWWMKYYYILLPFITATVAMNCIMIFSIIFRIIKNRLVVEAKVAPESPESLVLLIPCYNETKEELLKSLDSLVAQCDIESHKRAIMVVCDGKVRGPGMEKTTADYLLHDILTDRTERQYVQSAYLAWDQQSMDVVFQTGTYRGIPYMCIVKQQNQGKRDGLILIRSFLYNYNIRDERPKVIFSSKFFAHMTKFLLQAQFDRVDLLIGMDADTFFHEHCIWNLINESRYPKTVGVCGYVMVDFSGGQWNIWRLYQSAEYTIAQGLRRLHQSIVTKKVSCLPGCCQLLKICEETCGEEVLIEKFGYCPSVNDGLLTQVRATASEDRNHVCHMLSSRPHAETRQALGAKAVTDVPHSWSVFLSQRRRWTLGATSNDLFLTSASGVQWFERILAIVNVFTWFLNPFILASIASFIFAIMHVSAVIIMIFVSIMLVPICYYVCIPLWITKSWRDRFQFWLGCTCYIFCGPFINIGVLLYASWNMDSFGWGKTRKVISTDGLSDGSDSDNVPALHRSEAVRIVRGSSQLEGTDRMEEIVEEEKKIGH